MPHSNLRTLSGALILALVFAGCTKPEKQDPSRADEQNADFRVETGKASGWADPILRNDSWQKPLSTTFQFEACLKDRGRDTKLLNQNSFVIEDPASHRRFDPGATNPEGCLIWNEPIPFNYFVKRSRWVSIDRDIIGTGIHRGRRRVTFAVNPWAAAHRKEMAPSKEGYFLRDEPLELKNPADRLTRVYDFFKESLKRQMDLEGGANPQTEQQVLDAWKAHLENGGAKSQSLVAAPKDAVAALNGDDEGTAELWIDDIKLLSLKKRNISVDETQADPEKGYLIQQTLTMKPRLRIQQANGADVFEDIVQGDFDVFVQVVATDAGFDQGKKLILSESLNRVNAADPIHPTSPDGVGKVVDGQLIAYVNFKVNKRVAEGNVDLVVRLVPRRIGNRAPKTFEGIFNMGKVNNWVGGSTTATIAQNCVPGLAGTVGCSYEKYLGEASNYLEMRALREAAAAEPYQFANIKARFVQVDTGEVQADPSGQLRVQTGETATRRTVLYSASTCVTDASGDRLARQKFIIRYLDSSDSAGNTKPIEKVTDDSGCLLWTNTITHSYYKPEKFFRQVISLEGPGGAKRVKTVYINPWDDKFTFGFDEEELGKEFFDRIAKRPRIPSRFYMGDYAYHTVRFLYEIDPYMDLEVKKTVLMDLQPKVLRYSGIISGRKVTEYLRDGIYMMKVGIQKSYLDPSDRFRRLCEVDRARAVKDKDGKIVEHWERATVSDPELCALSREQRKLSLDDQMRSSSQQQHVKSSLAKFQDTVAPKDFIATKTSLVRVTDGLIIQPVELSMKDLRLMRIRSNFLIQLETVDERKVLFNDQLSQTYRKLTADMLAERRKKAEEFRVKSVEQTNEEQIEKDRASSDQIMVKAAAEKRDYIRDLYERELNRLNLLGPEANIVSDFNRQPGELGKLLERFEGIKDPIADLKDTDPKLEEENRRLFERYHLYKSMAQNDFTKISLPDCDKVNCEDFKEADSGLEPRTFVGPVIFLSNSYKDAMRATDNLDEARCHEQIEGVDYQPDQITPAERELLNYESTLLTKRSEELQSTRTNNAYRYNKYFSSLRQFCVRDVPAEQNGGRSKVEFYPKQVDDLIHEEKSLKEDYLAKMKALATPYNFASIFNLDFFSFGGEKLRKIDGAKIKAGCVKNGIDSCMTVTNERSLEASQLVELANRNLNSRSWSAKNNWATWKFLGPLADKEQFDLADVNKAIFGADPNQSNIVGDYSSNSTVPICGILASLAGDNYLRTLNGATPVERDALEKIVFNECFSKGAAGFRRDRKLRIYNTGDYAFMGGMQLNFNVTYSFGVSRSDSVSAGVDLIDLGKESVGILATTLTGAAVAGPPGALAGFSVGILGSVLKPFDLKRGTSMGESKGTSISEQTYLVGQIAKFSIPLKEWEQCTVLRLFPEAVQSIRGLFEKRFRYGAGTDGALFDRFVSTDHRAPLDERVDEKINSVFGRGLFVCDGVHRTKEVLPDGKEKEGKDIDELYFYFTQHFTEGDMLDQADLYNNPWLLSLRGLRDFSAFVQLIRGQEVVGFRNFVDGLIGERPKTDTPGWALDHMANIYKSILPSFPGLYTVLDQGEGMDFFPLKSKNFSYRDMDINSEVNRVVEPVGHVPNANPTR